MQTFAKFALKWPEIQEKPFGGRAPPGPTGVLTALHQTP